MESAQSLEFSLSLSPRLLRKVNMWFAVIHRETFGSRDISLDFLKIEMA